ncbi:MAG TPA: nucleotide exchange factor GrpE [Enhygromyxa sp.]|nr:nucleotide exchange factor GrpE [Enhygromyxa sp.]
MSGDHDPQQPNIEGDIEEVMRAAEQAVDKVRSGQAGSQAGAEDAGEDEIEVDGDDDLTANLAADLAVELEQAQAEVASLRDKWLRAVADLDNYKKRVKRDIDDAIHRSTQNLLSSFLSVGDNLDRALSVAPPDTNEQLLKGLEMVRQEFVSALAKHGIKPIESVGRPFDPNLHDALQQMDSPDFAPGIVMLEYEKGYQRNDKLLRPARVIVAGPGSTGAPPEQPAGEAN